MRQADILDKISRIMLDAGVEASPNNYELCYLYVTRSDPVVCRAFELELTKSSKIDSEVFQRIVDASTIPTSSLQSHMIALERQVANVSGAVTETADDAASYSEFLNLGAANLNALKSGADARTIVAELIERTSLMSRRTAALEASLATANEELSSVRNDLTLAKRESGTDALTGLPNRRAFDIRLEEEIEEARKLRHPLTVAFGDIDHFKKFNDTWGHKLGDDVLRYVGAQMKEHFGGVGYISRFGGEEFAVILPGLNTSKSEFLAKALCERQGGRVLKTRREGENEPTSIGKITMSIGVATWLPRETPELLMERADKAMYEAKQAGRNCVMCAKEDMVTR